jgi:putative IMPACT (imprinted ancient) family translation regulator
VRAYSGGVTAALESATVVPRVRSLLFRLEIGHADAGWVEAGLRGRGFEVVGVEYRDAAVITLACVDPDELQAAVAELTTGRGNLVAVGHVWR